MTDPKLRRAQLQLDVASMSAERPLDALLPALRLPPVPREPVHPRVLETPTADDKLEWVLLVWEDPGGAAALHNAVRVLVEAAMLAELSQPPSKVRARPRRALQSVRLVVYADLPFDPEPALRAFGFKPATDHPLGRTSERVVEDEAERTGRRGVDLTPRSAWIARATSPPGTLGERLGEIQVMMADRMGDDIWGRTPGGPSRLFAMYLQQFFGEKLQPTRDGLVSMELFLVQQTPEVIRWLPPLVFQALCDFIPVVAASQGATVAWAECDEVGDGFAQPPLFRLDKPSGPVHVPVGQHVLQWWMMPLRAGEQVPSIADWLADQLAT